MGAHLVDKPMKVNSFPHPRDFFGKLAVGGKMEGDKQNHLADRAAYWRGMWTGAVAETFGISTYMFFGGHSATGGLAITATAWSVATIGIYGPDVWRFLSTSMRPKSHQRSNLDPKF